jgi:hypothetical protein
MKINGSPLFLRKIFPHGNEKKEQRIILVAVFYLYRRIDFCNRHTLALADIDHAFCIYFFCSGNGYRLSI